MRTGLTLGLAVVFLIPGCGDDGDPNPEVEPPPSTTVCTADELGLNLAVSVAVDASNVFIADIDPTETTGAIVRADKACGQVERLVEGAAPSWVGVHGDSLYWVTEDALLRSTKDGEQIETLYAGPNIKWRSVAFDEGAIYFVVGDELLRIDPSGGPPETFASPGCGTSGVAVDATHVYATQGGCAGDVMRWPKDGGPVEIIAVTQWSAEVALDDEHVYWVRHTFGALSQWPKTGGVARVYPGVVHSPGYLTLDDDAIYYAGEGEVGGFHRDGSDAWNEWLPAYDAVVDGAKLYAVGEDRLTILETPAFEVTGFSSGDASLRIEWQAECDPDSRISFLLGGPTNLNATVACDDMAITFGSLAPGKYTYVAEHADSSVGFEGNPVEVEGDVVVGPIDLMPLD
jgi:hypothetical protein